ncbi:12614_t:CDS:1, partial [Funneliformis geosporum]
MPVTKQNSTTSKNFQTTQPYPITILTNENKTMEQTAYTQQKNKSNTENVSVTNKRTKISNEVSSPSIENIVESIILTPSPNVEMDSALHQTPPPFLQQIEDKDTSTMEIDATTSNENKKNSTNDSMHANQISSTLSQQYNYISPNNNKGKQKEM